MAVAIVPQLFFYTVTDLSGTITALVIQKKNKERVNVFLDHDFAFAITLNAAFSLKKGQHLSDDAIETLKHTDAIDKAYQQSLNFLSYRARSEAEVAQYLRKKETADDIIELVTARLRQRGYLNDAEFGAQWVAGRSRTKPKGARALRYELRQKGLSDADIDAALVALDEESLAWQAVEHKLSRWQSLDAPARRKKISAFLARRGFNYDVISATLAKIEDQYTNLDN